MDGLLYFLIIALGLSSYVVALNNIRRGFYRPNTFSRAIWSVLAINSFVGVLVSDSTVGSLLLAGVMLAGSIAMFFGSLWRGRRVFGRLEVTCLFLFGLSLTIWLFFDQPLVNIALSLFAHFVGALPTYRQAWRKPRSESGWFWGLFLAASIFSVVVSWGSPVQKQLVPIYYTLFDGSVFLLTLRRYQKPQR